jgi:predicted AAA+ superfamily ATPase
MRYTEREIKETFKKVFSVYNIVALVGARQSGKTTFLKERMKQLNASYVLFDDPDARELFEEDVKKFERQYVEGHDVTVLDEVQYCRDAGRKLKYLADTGKRLWITSSSEIILGKEVLSYLVGRVSVIKLYPFSLREFLASKGKGELTQKIIDRNVWEHVTYGGYPRVVTMEDIEMKKIILRDLYETMLLKDVARTFSIEDIRALEEFARYMSVNIGCILSYENVSRNVKISFQTLKKYLDAMEKSYVIVRVLPFYTNKGKEITKQPKVYFVDTGLRNIAAKKFDTKPDGKLFENYVLTELMKMGFIPKYWRTNSQAEVDFVIEEGDMLIPIEVKLNAEHGRIEKSTRSFIETYKPKKAFVVSYKTVKGETKVGGCKVIFTDVFAMKQMLSKQK